VQLGKGTQLQFRSACLPTSPLEDEDDDEDSLPDEALRSVVGNSVNERSRENDVPHECRCARLRRSLIFIATVGRKAISSPRSGIEAGSRIDVAPLELLPFSGSSYKDLAPPEPFFNPAAARPG